MGFPCTQKGYDAIWVIVDRLTKIAHFIPIKEDYRVNKLAELFVDNILRSQHLGALVSDKGPQFTARFWQKLHESIGSTLESSSAYRPQTDGQTERMNQILEDLLRACVLAYGSEWEKSLSYAKFTYNNSYQASSQMSSFEALYGRKSRTPLMWSEVGEQPFFGPESIQEAEENVAKITENLKVA